MRKYSKRSLQSLNGIHPDLRRVIDRALQDSPLDFVVIEGLRTKTRQAELVAAGKSKTMNSRHLTGHAVDLMPIGHDGVGSFSWPLYDLLGPAVKAAAEAEGVALDWGGDWETFRDGPHFQLRSADYPASEFTSTAAPPKDKKPRTSVTQSTTVKAAGTQIIAGAGVATSAIQATSGVAQYLLIGGGILVILLGGWILRERIKKWADGIR
jgi:peptidoglycan L-alanyl-D-glutamate endopeptidase CwlK